MARNHLRGLACLLAVIIACLSTLPASAQQIDEELLDLLKTLPDDERAELLRAYGLPAAGEGAAPERDVSTPQVVLPREQLPSELEAAVAGERLLESDEGPVAPPLEALTGEALEIQRAFENFLAESQPLEVDRQLVQFGYELFAGAPTTFAPATDIPVSSDYIMGPGDEVHVQLYGKTSFSKDRCRSLSSGRSASLVSRSVR